MSFVPLDLVLKRVERNGDTDSALFHELLYAGEFVLKSTVAALVASVEDDPDAHRYRLLHSIVRADGIGEWARNLNEVLRGPASQHLSSSLSDVRRTFTERLGKESWQYEAVHLLQDTLLEFVPDAQELGDKVSLDAWFIKFSELRNKTRGHGAVTPASCARVVSRLKKSIWIVAQNNPLFDRPWAYLHENLSGKYRVSKLGGESNVFDELTRGTGQRPHYADGIYIISDRPRLVELMRSDLDLSDFFLPNGAFNSRTFELHSLITDDRSSGDAAPYLSFAGDKPPSETEGMQTLGMVGKVFTNLPPVPIGYVSRPILEADVYDKLTNDRHPIITLVGTGGIGKTSAVLSVLHNVAQTERFQIILWFSSRDIDLTASGPKVVKPKVLAEKEIASEYVSLISALGEDAPEKKNQPAFMATHMNLSPLGPILFVFDNFETVRSPVDLFQWIDAHIRLPNKVAITSRFRDFKADYPIEVHGMETEEADILISQTATSLGIANLIHKSEREQIYDESDGHPYVLKIILGEIANDGKFSKPKGIIARKEEILDALFERTFASLSPLAARIFLMLSGWRSLVPQIAVVAVLARHGSDIGDPERAINDLVRMSLVERTTSGDESDFLGVPLAAAIFGNKKLEVSAQRQLIEGEIKFLQGLGATNQTGAKAGVGPKITSLIKTLAKSINKNGDALEDARSILEFLASSYSPAWLLLADLQDEVVGDIGTGVAAVYVRRFLETKPPEQEAVAAWTRLLAIYRSVNDVVGGCSAFLRLADLTSPPLYQISSMANWLNSDSTVIERMTTAERSSLLAPMAGLMEQHLKEASATELSRLAWLHLHAGDSVRAKQVADIGLERDPDSVYCLRLVEKLAK